MEILKNVQLLDDSYLAEVSGGVNLKAAQAQEGFAKFISSLTGIFATAGAAVTTIALTVLGTIFLPKTRRFVTYVAAKGPEGWRSTRWGKNAQKKYAYEDSANSPEGYVYVEADGDVPAHIERAPVPTFEA